MRVLSLCLILIVVVLFAACSGGEKTRLQPVGIDSPPDIEAPASPFSGQLPEIPPAREPAMLTESTLLGSEDHCCCDNATVDGTCLDLAAAAGELSWGIWRFNTSDAVRYVDVCMSAGSSCNLWLGLANYSTNSWDISGPYVGRCLMNLDPLAHVSGSGDTFVAVIVWDGGSAEVETLTLLADYVNAAPVAALQADPMSGNPPLEVNFDASGSSDSDGSIAAYLWDFDDDGDFDDWSAGPNVTHIFTDPGDYTVLVRVDDEQSAQDTASVVVHVNYAPVADLQADVTVGDPPLMVNFDASGSSDADGTVVDYEWDLDGNGIFNEPGDEADAQGSPTTSHVYQGQGIRMPCVRVTDDDAIVDTASVEIKLRGWVYFVIDDTADSGCGPSGLAMINGHPAISYTRYEDSLQYVRSTTPTGSQPEDWTQIVLIEVGDKGECSSLAEVDGNPAISYDDHDNGCLKYVRSTTSEGNHGEDWTGIVVVDSENHAGHDSSLAVVNGKPAIAYTWYEQGVYDHKLRYAVSSTTTGSAAGDWTVVTVDNSSETGYNPSLAVVDGCPAISYHNDVAGCLMYARSTTSSGASASDWTQLIEVDVGNTGWYSWLAVIDGNPAISYYDVTNSALKYARSTTSTGAAAGDWTQIVVVDNDGAVGEDTSMAFCDNRPVISYSDSDNRHLKFAGSSTATGADAGDWSNITLDDNQDVGFYGCIAAVGDSIGIAYHDSNLEALKYAYYVK